MADVRPGKFPVELPSEARGREAMPIEDNQVMTDADRYLFRRLHDHARTLERILAEHPEHRDRPEFEAAIADLNRAAEELLMTKP